MLTLYPYQLTGSRFLANRKLAYLADEMRVGKSPQTVVACDRLNLKTIIVLCPASARYNWQREFDKWSFFGRPSVLLFTQKDRPLTHHINICSYQLLLNPGIHTALQALNADVLVLDEAHYLKSLTAKRSKLVFGKNGLATTAQRVWCLSGTPMPSHPGELWVWLHCFGVYKYKYQSYIQRFCTGYHDGFQFRITGGKNIPKLKKLVADSGVLLRRKMKDVRPEVPSLIYEHRILDPNEVDESKWFPRWEVSTRGRETMIDQRVKVEDILKAAKSTDPGQALAAISKSVATLRRYTSMAKLEAFIELVEDELLTVQKIVIFAIHRETIEQIHYRLNRFKPKIVYGGTRPVRKQRNLDLFNNPGTRVRVLIGNIDATKENIDLSIANHVWFMEESWVPGDNAQAAMRCQNLNKKEPVTVRFVGLANSVDEHVSRVLMRKTQTLTEMFD